MTFSLNSGHSDKGCLLRPASRFTKTANTKIPNKFTFFFPFPRFSTTCLAVSENEYRLFIFPSSGLFTSLLFFFWSVGHQNPPKWAKDSGGK